MVARKITVVQMLPELESGGVEAGTLEMGAYLARMGHKSLVISEGGRMVKQLEEEGSRHLMWPHVGEKSPRALAHVLSLRNLLLREKVDILHLRSRLPAWIGLLAWKSLPVNRRPHLVTTFHGFYSVNAYSAVMTRGEKVIAISDTISDHIQEAYGLPTSRIVKITEGIDEKRFSPRSVSKARIDLLRSLWNLDGQNAPVILLPGRITRLKGHDVMIRALKKIEHLPWTALCVGEGDKKSGYYGELLDLIASSGLSQRIHFPGNCSDMPAALMLADIVISSSKEPESFGRTAVEAMAMEKTVIATAHGGSLETVLAGITGFLVPPDHEDDMASALMRVLSSDGNEMGMKARRRVMDLFTLDRMCRETLDLYEHLLDKK